VLNALLLLEKTSPVKLQPSWAQNFILLETEFRKKNQIRFRKRHSKMKK
jgi:hypothetical protein